MAYNPAERTLKELYDLKLQIQNMEETQKKKQEQYFKLREQIHNLGQMIGHKQKKLMEAIRI